MVLAIADLEGSRDEDERAARGAGGLAVGDDDGVGTLVEGKGGEAW